MGTTAVAVDKAHEMGVPMSPSKILLWVLFVSAPSIIFTTYVVHKLRGILLICCEVQISDFNYALGASIIILASAHLSSRRVYRELFGNQDDTGRH